MKKLTFILFVFALLVNINAQDTVYVYPHSGMIRIDGVESTPVFLNPQHLSFTQERDYFLVKDQQSKNEYDIGSYNEIFKIDTTGFSSNEDLFIYLTLILNRSLSDVALQDQTTQPIIINFNKIAQSTTLAADRAVGDTFITVSDTLGAANNTYVIIFNPTLKRVSTFNTISISIDTIFLDAPIDVAYDSGSFVDFTAKEMAIDGSGTSQTFGIRGVSASPVGITFDVTRIIMSCITDSPVDLSRFGDIAGGLTNGLILRKRDGNYYNIFNVKSNQEIAGIDYDFTPYLATNPAQGQDGFVTRLTFAGQNKIGVAIRLGPGEDLEFIIQDDLSSITSFLVVAEGHIVED